MLENYIREKRKNKEILLMTHIVVGYPSFEESFRIVEAMVEAGVDLMELQIPFSEPIADGPVILRANQESLSRGSTVAKCLDFGKKAADAFDIPFLFMTYYNVLFKAGVKKFAETMNKSAIKGAIVPDLPPEEGQEYLEAMDDNGLDPIFIFSPNTPDSRMKFISSYAKGFVYCVARKGVTGANTDFDAEIDAYLERCRNAVDLPLALGFGVKDKADVDFLRGKVDIAVVGSQTIRVVEEKGVSSVGPFISSLR